jgi:hypothetical protein
MRKSKLKSKSKRPAARKPASKSKRLTKHATVSVGRKSKMKRAATRKAFDAQMGRPTGRDAAALSRRQELIEDYVRDGMEPAEARQRAIAVMRDNPKKDWRRG